MTLGQEDSLDVKLKMEGNKVLEFSLNYRAKIAGHFHEVYRVDTAHGFLHEQRHWISPEPIPLHVCQEDLNLAVTFFTLQIKQNYERYKQYFLNKRRFDEV
ncbi:MAG: hypothetical protein NUV67_01485 [archaeon]|nr:hypothetical protein [archaeon]